MHKAVVDGIVLDRQGLINEIPRVRHPDLGRICHDTSS